MSSKGMGLKWSLLIALGVVPSACGATVKSQDPDKSSCSAPSIDAATGLETCEQGYTHRPSANACLEPGEAVTAAAKLPIAPSGSDRVDCSTDASICDQFAYGSCFVQGSPIGQQSHCISGCAVDDDCTAGQICACGAENTPGLCIPTRCAVDADCGAGSLCVEAHGACGERAFVCQSAKDECNSDADCGDTMCTFVPEGDGGYRSCKSPGCAVGRPFLVQDVWRVAPLAKAAGWSDAGTPAVTHLSDAERAVEAAHWARLGQLEHASIAAFARFQLQLLALGAPPELLDACTQATADETAHARLCFGFASVYAGYGVGPGPLDISGSLDATSLAGVVELVIAEGCFGETSATLEALEAAEVATDSVVALAYVRIAADEQRHAELAFRFVAWALQQDFAQIAPLVRHALASAQQSEAVRDVVAPCLEALLSRELLAA